MRLGVFGGSFNPIHNGHLQIAQEAIRDGGLTQLFLMVAANPPHKKLSYAVPPEIRLEMAKLAAEDIPELQASSLEIDRGGKSYTSDTVAQLKSQYPGAQITWLIGGDMLLTLDTWHEAAWLMQNVRFLVAGRPDSPGIAEAARRLQAEYGAEIVLLPEAGPNISSSQIRERMEAGLPIEGMTPPKVIQYIYEKGLYMPQDMVHMIDKLRLALDDHRFRHTMGVVRTAALLAERHGVDPEKVRQAALLHDCAKGRADALAQAYGMDVGDLPAPVRHGPVGAEHARRSYGIADPQVLQAISRHTVCGAGMTDLDKVIYLADKTEPGRQYDGLEDIRKAAEESLDLGMATCLAHTAAYLAQRGEPMHPASLAAWEEIDKTIKRR